MKLLFNYQLILCLALLLIVSCSEEEDPIKEVEEKEVELAVSKTVFNFGSEGGSEGFEITSNAIWNIEYDKALWAKPSIQTAQGNANITLTVDKNESAEVRTMVFTVTSERADDIVVNISQEGGEAKPTIPDYIEPDKTGMRDMTSLQLSSEMGVGWNLGNSLEAINVNNGNYSGNETSWGNPVVSKRLIDSVKAAGFNTIRIPVSWSHMLEDEETFKISYAWKQRVEEVVNYALDNDMYVMINIHWDGGWMNQPFYDNQEAINNKLAALWKQIAIYFRDYDDHLLFAGTNEVHVAEDYGTPSTENTDVQNSFNQTFVDIVRATGGRNTYRHLIVQSYNTNIAHGVDFMTIPDDDTEDRLMVEVHFYDPYQFALQETDGTAVWGEAYQDHATHAGWGDEAWIDEAFGEVKTNFVDEGYPVILGEYGAILRENPTGVSFEEHLDIRNHYLNYVTEAALANGMVPFYWDNGYAGNKGFGLFDRSTGEMEYPEAVVAIVDAL